MIRICIVVRFGKSVFFAVDRITPLLKSLGHRIDLACGAIEGTRVGHVHLVLLVKSLLPLFLSKCDMRLRHLALLLFSTSLCEELCGLDKVLVEAQVEVDISHAGFLPEFFCWNGILKGHGVILFL